MVALCIVARLAGGVSSLAGNMRSLSRGGRTGRLAARGPCFSDTRPGALGLWFVGFGLRFGVGGSLRILLSAAGDKTGHWRTRWLAIAASGPRPDVTADLSFLYTWEAGQFSDSSREGRERRAGALSPLAATEVRLSSTLGAYARRAP